MGLPLFVAPPSPTVKNASTNTEKAVAQNRSTIRRQRTVRGHPPSWALSDMREVPASARHLVPGQSRDERDFILMQQIAARNRSERDNFLSFERRTNSHDRYIPPAPSVPATTSNSEARSGTPRMSNPDDPTDRFTYISNMTVRAPSGSPSPSPPLPSYTPGFPPAHVMTSDVRSSLRRESPERPTSTRPTMSFEMVRDRLNMRSHRSSDYSSSFPPSRASRSTRMSELLAQRGRRIRARYSPDGLGDRDRSMSPETPADWDTLSITLTPDPQAPSTASSSFASANASTNPSTAIASAASSTSDSQSSATTASGTSNHPLSRYRINRRGPSPGHSTRSIPDFSIPSEAPEQRSTLQSPPPNPDSAMDGNCDSSDELDFHEADENMNSIHANENINNEENQSESDREDNAEEEDLYELAESEENPIVNGTRPSFWRSYAEVVSPRDPREVLFDLDPSTNNRRITRPNPLTRSPPASTRRREVLPSWARDALERSISESEPNRTSTSTSALTRRSLNASSHARREEVNNDADGDGEDESNTLGGMQRIVRRLAERRDIPDTWWAGAGLSRTAVRGVVREGDDDVRT